jgi:hypothetical protein
MHRIRGASWIVAEKNLSKPNSAFSCREAVFLDFDFSSPSELGGDAKVFHVSSY